MACPFLTHLVSATTTSNYRDGAYRALSFLFVVLMRADEILPRCNWCMFSVKHFMFAFFWYCMMRVLVGWYMQISYNAVIVGTSYSCAVCHLFC